VRTDESNGIRKENLPQVQDRAAQGRGAGDLLRPAAQAETRMTSLDVVVKVLLNQI
jgi:hypothetical protein